MRALSLLVALCFSPLVLGQPSITVKIAHVAPLTGGIAHLGRDNENGARLAIEQANAAHIRLNGKQVEFVLVAEDDEADPRTGVRVAQKLVDLGVVGVIGHLNSGTSIPASGIYESARIPMVSPSATNPKLTEQRFQHVYRIQGRDDLQGAMIAGYLNDTRKLKLVALVDDGTAYGESLTNSVESYLRSVGIRTLKRERGTDKTVDWYSTISRLKVNAPDVVFFGGMDDTAAHLIKQGIARGLNAIYAFGDGACTAQLKELAGSAAIGAICVQVGISPKQSPALFRNSYRSRFSSDPILYAAYAYDATNVLIHAMKQADSAEPARYVKKLQTMRHEGVTGIIEFDSKGDRKNADFTIFRIDNEGNPEPISVVAAGGKTTTRLSGGDGSRWLKGL